jgi:hypothetical protein
MTWAPLHLRSAVARLTVLSILALVAIALAGPASAFARGGGGGGGGADDTPGADNGGRRPRVEVRVNGSCGRGAQSWLKLQEDDSGIEVEFEIHHARPGAAWRLAIVHERRIDYRGRHRTRSTGALDINETLADLSGADAISVRAWGPRGVTCTASAVLPGT